MAVIDSVERRFQARVQDPQPFGGLAAQRVEDGLDRVLAATSRPEPVGSGLEPGLPLGLQRIADMLAGPRCHRAWDDGALLSVMQACASWKGGSAVRACRADRQGSRRAGVDLD